jgi:hypothetical protein
MEDSGPRLALPSSLLLLVLRLVFLIQFLLVLLLVGVLREVELLP